MVLIGCGVIKDTDGMGGVVVGTGSACALGGGERKSYPETLPIILRFESRA